MCLWLGNDLLFGIKDSRKGHRAGGGMKVLFLTLIDVESIEEHNIYTDLLREFVKNGHKIYIISPIEHRKKQNTYLIKESNSTILKLKIGNIQKANILEKGFNTIFIEFQFVDAIKKHFSSIKFDFILYSTPPITLGKAVKYVKNRDKAKTYLLLKDIFPQNAVDIGIMSKDGVKGIIYRYFRAKEKALYRISDWIGCMSKANMEYILRHNLDIKQEKIEICPNSIEPFDMRISNSERKAIRKKYNIPEDRIVFIYGGNLGKPQGIGFMLKCLHSQRNNIKVFFLIIGNGTEYGRIRHYLEKYKPENIALHQWLPKEDYDKVLAACDVGLIFLDYKFTIPNFPSRLLSYMNVKLPVLACTDRSTDIGRIIVENNFGWWCASNDVQTFEMKIEDIGKTESYLDKSKNAYSTLLRLYSVEDSYEVIVAHNCYKEKH